MLQSWLSAQDKDGWRVVTSSRCGNGPDALCCPLLLQWLLLGATGKLNPALSAITTGRFHHIFGPLNDLRPLQPKTSSKERRAMFSILLGSRESAGAYFTHIYFFVFHLCLTLFGMMMMSPPRCDWPVLLSVNPPPDWFDYLKQRKRWMGDSNLATVSVFSLFLPFSPRLCLTSRVFPSLLSFPLSFPPILPLLR